MTVWDIFMFVLFNLQLPKIENYVSGDMELNITIGRVFVLRLVYLGVLVYSLYQKVTQVIEFHQ